MIVDSAIYVEGRRVSTNGSVTETYKKCRDVKGVAWIGLYQPTEEEFESVAKEFELGVRTIATE